jgi:hypothetical protein
MSPILNPRETASNTWLALLESVCFVQVLLKNQWVRYVPACGAQTLQ